MYKMKLVLLVIALVLSVGFMHPQTSTAASEPETKINILSNPFGASGYVLSFALADMINKNSTWLRATCVETKSSTVNVKTVADDPKKRENTLIFSSAYTNLKASRGDAPFKGSYTSIRWVGKTIVVGAAFISSSPKIRKPQDMIGKSTLR